MARTKPDTSQIPSKIEEWAIQQLSREIAKHYSKWVSTPEQLEKVLAQMKFKVEVASNPVYAAYLCTYSYIAPAPRMVLKDVFGSEVGFIPLQHFHYDVLVDWDEMHDQA